MNPILLLVYNTTDAQLRLAKLCVESIFTQTIPVHLLLVDNGSSVDTATRDWTEALVAPAPHTLEVRRHRENTAPTSIVNRECATLFALGAKHVLGVPSDAILPPYCYEQLLSCSTRGFVAAYMHSPEPPQVPESLASAAVWPEKPVPHILHENMHVALTLTRKWAFDALVAQDGYFMDEGMFMYACDLDLKTRIAKVGIVGAQTDITVYHYSSACWRLATPEVARTITTQANNDRAYLARKQAANG